MQTKLISIVSLWGVPGFGLCALLTCLGHSTTNLHPQSAAQSITLLQEPDARLDKSLTICLRQEAKEVARCRRRAVPRDLVRAVADYNLVARECTPTVFAVTHLPPVLEP